MKNLTYLAIGMAMAIFTASCSSDEPSVQPGGGDGYLTYEVQLPAEIQSRAFSDGKKAYYLEAVAYNADTKAPVTAYATRVSSINLTATMRIPLTNGVTYDVVFFAYDNVSPVSDAYKFDEDAGTLTIDYTKVVPNDDRFDFFYNVDAGVKISLQMPSRSITLTRPMAQLNVGTSDLEEDAVADAFPNGVQTKISTKAYSTMNLLTGVAGDEVDVTWAGILPKPKLDNSTSANAPYEVFPVGQSYDYLAMVYLLQNPTRQILNTKLEFFNGTAAVQDCVIDIPCVPYERNYRTNIFGSLLTNNTTYNVTIDPAYNEPFNMPEITVSTQAELEAAVYDTNYDIIVNLTPGVDYVLPPVEAYRPVIIRGAAPTTVNNQPVYSTNLTVNQQTRCDLPYLAIENVNLNLPDNNDQPRAVPFAFTNNSTEKVYTNGRTFKITNCNVEGSGIEITGMQNCIIDNVKWTARPQTGVNSQALFVNIAGNVTVSNSEFYITQGAGLTFYKNQYFDANTEILVENTSFATDPATNSDHDCAVDIEPMYFFNDTNHAIVTLNNVTYTGYDKVWGFYTDPNKNPGRDKRVTVIVDGTQVWPATTN